MTRERAVAYLIVGLLLLADTIIAVTRMNIWMFVLSLACQFWWLWAVIKESR